jgi:glutaredoxin
MRLLEIIDCRIDIDKDRASIYNQYIEMKKQNSLAFLYPEIASEWHPTKNLGLLPDMISAGSDKKVWWLGKCGHEWQEIVANRIKKRGCPYCSGHRVLAGFNDLLTRNPELADEWHPTKNGNLTPNMVSEWSGKKVWWLGKCGHEWQSTINVRSRGTNCPYCSGQKVLKGFNDIETVNPRLSSEWHPTKNGELTSYMFTPGSGRKVWWLGKCRHEWQAIIYSRSNGNGCPYCAGQKVLKGFNDLTTINPQLASEWHPTKNGDLKPDMITSSANKKIWWKCKNGHEWQTTINNRNRGSGCPICARQKRKV